MEPVKHFKDFLKYIVGVCIIFKEKNYTVESSDPLKTAWHEGHKLLCEFEGTDYQQFLRNLGQAPESNMYEVD